MKSFMKSHKRGSTGSTAGTLFVDAELAELRHSDDSQTGPTVPPSPNKTTPTSPTGKTKKLRGLFQRSKGSSQNLVDYNISPISPSRITESPSIIGTRTHEWGNDTQRSSVVKASRIHFDPSYSSKSLDSLADISNSHGDLPLKEDLLQLPLNTVLEIPDKIADSSLTDIKNIHRRAQILTPDVRHNNGIEVPFSSPENSDLETVDDEVSIKDELVQQKATAFDVPNITEIKTPDLAIEHSLQKDKFVQVILETDEDEAYESDFSFEENERAGRNASIRYYKTPKETQAQHQVREQGFYINDLIEDDNFDEEVNFFDDNDDFNDDEELFNRKYFSDEDEEEGEDDEGEHDGPDLDRSESPLKSALVSKLDKPQTPELISSSSLLSGPPKELQPSAAFTDKSHIIKKSLKYHQLPTTLEQEYIVSNRYSWISDDEESFKIRPQDVNDSYDSLLDEINGIPEDYDSYDDEKPQVKPKLKSLKSRKEANLPYTDIPLNTKFKTSGKTVTLFNHTSRSNSLKSREVPEPQKFSYLTPNSSFNAPSPAFFNDKLANLSPISEGSVDGSP